ncbi:hypothetical protein QBC35DRAFT_477779 [Podospora australis]|uniref:Uncharacterized protein n=1 Tax=Podospora australis TaxID=1536484 RepID=A0AAN6WKZ9_9PEZI|nr:hypothetical protein QBC35DRAFT_477779 [Podospora australis]
MALLASVFNGKTGDIGDLVKGFDFSKISVTDRKSDEYLHTDLAPAYGKLNKESLLKMDDGLKIMIAGTMKMLSKQNNKSWNAVLSNMMQNVLLQPDGNEVARADKLIKESSNDFKFDGSADDGIVREVKSWFTKLIADDDVLESTKIASDIDVLSEIVAKTGATVDSFESFFAKNEHHEQTLVDIGVLRFPDIDRPFFKLYRIKLVAWSDSSRVLFHQVDKNGITGEFNSRIFRPRPSVIESLSAPARAKAIDYANALFDD